jgi:hypothetical protein
MYVFNEKTKTLVISLSQKPLAVHAWKLMYNKTFKLADDPALLYCMFNDPWESYCPWNFRIFTQKLITHKLFVVEKQNQLECIGWPLKKGQGQISRSSRFYENKAFFIIPSLHEILKSRVGYRKKKMYRGIPWYLQKTAVYTTVYHRLNCDRS